MTNEVRNEAAIEEAKLGGCVLWFFWGISLSFMTVLSLVLLALLAASVALNVYLGWEMSGLEVSISRPASAPLDDIPIIPTDVLVAIPTNTPVPPTPTNTPTSEPTESPLQTELSTLAAIATEFAVAQVNPNTPVPISPTPTILPTAIPPAVAIGAPAADTDSSEPAASDTSASTEASTASSGSSTPAAVVSEAQEFVPPVTSSNTYTLIPLEGERDKRPAEEHGDLNLKLRDPQPIEVDLSLVDIVDAGIDPNAPRLGDIFQPNFTSAYTVHNWDWGCNCKGELLQEDDLVLIGIATTPGEPIFIPRKDQDIFGGKFYALLLYASEDSLTFAYSRDGTVAHSYAVHYEGLHTDPNLLALYRESKGNELPGLTLDTPVGVAAGNELIVAMRDKGIFLDVRSLKDWWD